MSKTWASRSFESVAMSEVEQGSGASIQVLIGPEQGAPNFITRRFLIEKGGHIPLHSHPHIEHEQVLLSGSMVVRLGDEEINVEAGDALFIPAGLPHSYRNDGDVPTEFLCIVPRTSSYDTDWH